MPKTWEPKLLQSEAANHRADLETILKDLEHVAGCCDMILRRSMHPLVDLEAAALFDSMVIRYRRCFADGVRSRLKPETLPSLQGDEVHRHDFFFDVANKHVAHSVNGFELQASTVYIAVDEDGRLHRGGIGSHGSATLELSLYDIGQFCDLVRNLIVDVKTLHASFSNEVAREVEAMEDDALLALPEAYTPIDAKRNVDQRREWPKRSKGSKKKLLDNSPV